MPSPGPTATWGREAWTPTLIEALSAESVLLRAGANRVVADGRVIHVPRLLVNPDADWVAELTELPTNAGDADTIVLTPKKIFSISAATATAPAGIFATALPAGGTTVDIATLIGAVGVSVPPMAWPTPSSCRLPTSRRSARRSSPVATPSATRPLRGWSASPGPRCGRRRR